MKLEQADWLKQPTVRRLLDAFAQARFELRFVGGCVRDAIMNRPVYELDAATPATPEQVMALLQAATIKAVPTGLEHGTITAVVDHHPFEITTLRRDVACDGRHAQVEYTDRWEEDAARRDFALNALYCDGDGVVYDYGDGLADAKAGRIRFIGDADARIQEDGLRILRFFRFMATHGQGAADEAALAACTRHAAMLEGLSGERVHQEMMKLLAAPMVSRVLEWMQQGGVLAPIGLLQDALPDTLDAASHPLVRLAMLLRADAPSDEAAMRLGDRWKCSNKERATLRQLVTHERLLRDKAALTKQARRLGKESLALLLQRDAAEQGDDAQAMRQWLDQLELPVFPLSGADLMAAGIASGVQMGEMLRQLEDWWEAQAYQPDKEALLERLRVIHPLP